MLQPLFNMNDFHIGRSDLIFVFVFCGWRKKRKEIMGESEEALSPIIEAKTIYDFSVEDLDGKEVTHDGLFSFSSFFFQGDLIDMNTFRGKVLLFVNLGFR